LSQGAPLGNKNAAKAKVWEGAIRRALAQLEDPELNVKAGEALAKIAETVVRKAVTGDKDAIKEIGDRLDGKPVQGLVGADGGDLILQIVAKDAKA